MITLIIITAYIITVFIARQLNKVIYKRYDCCIIPLTWFLSILTIFAMLMLIIEEEYSIKYKCIEWFKGSNW